MLIMASRLLATSSLRQIRDQEHGYSQKEMASLLSLEGKSISRQYYTLIENGQRPIDVDLAITISRILRQPLEVLFIKKDPE